MVKPRKKPEQRYTRGKKKTLGIKTSGISKLSPRHEIRYNKRSEIIRLNGKTFYEVACNVSRSRAEEVKEHWQSQREYVRLRKGYGSYWNVYSTISH